MPKLTLRLRDTRSPDLDAFKKSVESLMSRKDLDSSTVAALAAEAFARGPRAAVHDANFMIDILGGLVKPGGESWAEQVTRYVISAKIYPYIDTAGPAEIELTEAECKFLSARLKSLDIKMKPIPTLMGIFMLELIEQLGFQITPAGE